MPCTVIVWYAHLVDVLADSSASEYEPERLLLSCDVVPPILRQP